MKIIQRDTTIDFLRATAIFLMIFLHTIAYYLAIPSINLLWDVLHFVVPIFLFYSLSLFYTKYQNIDVKTILSGIKKRLSRLFIPYYIFLIIASAIIYFFDRHNFTFDYFINSFLLIGGVDINWIILLFVIFTVLQPLLLYIRHRSYLLWNLFMAISFISTVVLLFYQPSTINYKLYFWIPWSIFLFYSYYHAHTKNRKLFYIINIICGVVLFFLSRFILVTQVKTLSLYKNEYPPNLYHLAYGFVILNFIFLIYPQKDLLPASIKKIIQFISINSYSLFFIHWLLIRIFAFYGFPWKYSWYLFFIAILISSLVIQYIFNVGLLLVRKQYNI